MVINYLFCTNLLISFIVFLCFSNHKITLAWKSTYCMKICFNYFATETEIKVELITRFMTFMHNSIHWKAFVAVQNSKFVYIGVYDEKKLHSFVIFRHLMWLEANNRLLFIYTYFLCIRPAMFQVLCWNWVIISSFMSFH